MIGSQRLISFFLDLLSRRHLIFEMAVRDFRAKYLGAYLGILWAFVHPTIYICILWFVFDVGFKSQPAGKTPFVLWMLAGIIPWFFFSECLAAAANSIVDNSYLLKKINFNIALLPIVKLMSSLFLHAFFLLMIVLMLMLYNSTVTIHILQVIYYLFAMLVLLLGVSWFTSSVTVFFRDMSQIVSMFTQF